MEKLLEMDMTSFATSPSSPIPMVNMTVQYVPVQYAYSAITVITCVFSLMGCFIIGYTFIRFKDLRTTSRKLLFYLSVTDCLGAIGYLFSAVVYLNVDKLSGSGDLRCQIPAAISIFADISSYLWTCALAVYLYLALVWNLITFANKLVWVFHITSWGIPASVVLAALICQKIGYNVRLVEDYGHPSWCKIDTTKADSVMWLYLAGKGWELGVYCLTGPLFLLTCLYVRNEIRRDREQMLGRESSTAIQSANRNLIIIPVLFIFLRIWGTIRFLVISHDPTHFHSKLGDGLLILQAAGNNSQGLVNAVVFCLCTKRVRRRLGRLFHRSHCRCYRTAKRSNVLEFHASFQRNTDGDIDMCSEAMTFTANEREPILT